MLEALSNPKTCPTVLPYYVLLKLGTTAEAVQLDTELGSSPSFATNPDKLSLARSIYFSKQLVNAGLTLTSDLVSSGWSASSAQATSELAHVLAALNIFRIATRFLLLPRVDSSLKNAGKQKELEVETIILRTCSKVQSLGMFDVARADCMLPSFLCCSQR